ncbi:MAG: glycosyltransferase family 2 protein [Tannerella sp.]|jgi:dolichol-phosphate mannosyltransferase|nr:glycosyltransferase family 2 protein [Tannerella sp.]
MSKLSVIIPCYNEEDVLTESYNMTSAVLKKLSCETEIIYINDGSSDCTAMMLNAIASQDNTVKVIHFSRNFGHQPAVSAGIHNCNADFAIIMDADLQDPPELIPDILELREKEQASVVYCVRKSREKESFFKRTSAKLFYRLINNMSEVKFPVDTGDFRLIDRTIMDKFNELREHGKYIRGLLCWMGFKQVPFYYERKARFAGETKYPIGKMVKFASNALLYFSKKPLLIAMGLGFVAVIIGLLLSVWFVLGKIFGFVYTETGWTSIITLVVFFGGIQLLTIGVLGQYIGVLFDEIKDRPEYIIEKKIGF